MKKLLHERLRDFPKGSFYGDLGETLGLGRKSDEELLGEYWDKIIPALADEIERYYIPRPRFEDGEPVQFGNQVGLDDLYMASPVDSMQVDEDGGWTLWGDGNNVYIEAGEIVKRPQPKVLDADGVEIKVGDTVYALSTGEGLYVEEVFENGQIRDTCRILFDSEDITHKEPDSLEKLRDDMDKMQCIDVDMVEEWTDRLSALIERGA